MNNDFLRPLWGLQVSNTPQTSFPHYHIDGWRQTKRALFPQNPVLYNGSRDGYIRTCDVRLSGSNWPVMCLSQGKMASVTCLRELHDENYLLSSGLDGSVRPFVDRKKIKKRIRPIFSDTEGTHCPHQWYCNVCISIFTLLWESFDWIRKEVSVVRIDRRLYSAALNFEAI